MKGKKKKILITGGAGFIGSNLINVLPKWEIVVLDSLIKQVHPTRSWEVPPGVKFICGDVFNKNTVRKSLEGVNYIVHLAAETGVGQSEYEIARYVKTNEYGTAVLLEEVSKIRDNLDGIIVASSRAVYGEGRYECSKCGIVYPETRKSSDLTEGKWNPFCPQCEGQLFPLPSVEDQLIKPVSIYGITKYNQEQLLQQFTKSFKVPGIALRFQNVYGIGQSLNNPYTGILSIFSTRILSKNQIFIYEDGNEQRDFIFVGDAIKSILLILNKGFSSDYAVYNAGTGKGTSVMEIAQILIDKLKKDTPLIVSGKYRVGDIRHAWADISKIKKDYGFEPTFSLEEGLTHFSKWVKKQPLPVDRYQKTEMELKDKGLLFEAKHQA
jgi:dTDP-L-rhamnose 4-epimerase